MEDNLNSTLSETGIPGFRVEASYLRGSDQSESGFYLGAGTGEDVFALIAGYDYRKYLKLNSLAPKKFGTSIELNISDGVVLHVRPSWTTTVKQNKPFYGGVHGIFATGQLQTWRYYSIVDSLDVNYNYYGDIYYGAYEVDENIPYSFTSLGGGVTVGMEFLSYQNYSLQLQVDASLVSNSFRSDWSVPDNVIWYSKEHEKTDGLSHNDDPTPLISGSLGINFFKPALIKREPLEPLPTPSYSALKQDPTITYDPETGEPTTSEQAIVFDPETGKIMKGTLESFDPSTGKKHSSSDKIEPVEKITLKEIKLQAQLAAKKRHIRPINQFGGAAACVVYPIGLPLAFLFVETGAISSFDSYDPFYLQLNSLQREEYEKEYKSIEKTLRRSSIYGTQLGCFVAFMALVLFD